MWIYYVVIKSGELLVQAGQTDGFAMTKLSGLQDLCSSIGLGVTQTILGWGTIKTYCIELCSKLVTLYTIIHCMCLLNIMNFLSL